MRWLTQVADKSGAVGTVVSAMGCASCFPALGALGASLGLGFIAQWEGLFINTLLPIFAWLVIAANVLGYISHRVWWRLLLGIAGPAMVLATLYLFWTDNWSTNMFYAGIGLMLAVSIFDLFYPAQKSCSTCQTGEAQ